MKGDTQNQGVKAIGGGGLKIFSCFNILSSPGFVEPGTFYRIEKFCPSVKIWRVKVGHYAQVLPLNGSEKGPKSHFLKHIFLNNFS